VKARARLVENPFFVLDLPVDASRVEVEREAQKLLGMLELGLAQAQRYASPLGWHDRTSDLVRAAAAALRDPQRRLIAEAWAMHARITADVDADADVDMDLGSGDVVEVSSIDTVDAWPGARHALGWGAR
jgi:hypothetical protein